MPETPVTNDITSLTPLDDLRQLANRTLSLVSLSKCVPLAASLHSELGLGEQLWASHAEVDSAGVLIAHEIIRRFVAAQRADSFAAVRADPDARQEAAAASELLGIPYEDGDTTFDALRRQVRGVGDDRWDVMLSDNDQPKKRRQLRTAVWLRPAEVYAYKAVANQQDILLKAFLAQLKAYVRKHASSLREALVAAQPEARHAGAPSPTTMVGYVSRVEPEDEYAYSTSQGAQLIAFVGRPGVGKSQIARHLASQSPTFAPVLRFRNGQIVLANLIDSLDKVGCDAQGCNQSAWITYFNRLVGKLDEPRLIVLDDLQDLGEVRDLNLDASGVTVIATSHTTHGSAIDKWVVIEVQEMTNREAMKLIKMQIGDYVEHLCIDREEMWRLGVALDGHPLVIKHACDLIKRGFLQSEQLRKLAPLPLGSVVTDSGVSLESALQQKYFFLEQHFPDAARLVRCAVLMDRDVVINAVAWIYLEFTSTSMFTPLDLVHAARHAQDSRLLDYDDWRKMLTVRSSVRQALRPALGLGLLRDAKLLLARISAFPPTYVLPGDDDDDFRNSIVRVADGEDRLLVMARLASEALTLLRGLLNSDSPFAAASRSEIDALIDASKDIMAISAESLHIDSERVFRELFMRENGLALHIGGKPIARRYNRYSEVFPADDVDPPRGIGKSGGFGVTLSLLRGSVAPLEPLDDVQFG